MVKKPDVMSAKQGPLQNPSSHSPPNFMFRPVRTRLLEDLERSAMERPKVLGIVAPIGYGKTVLMSELYAHLRQSGEHCFWVGLDDRDASVARLLGSLEAAVAGETVDVHARRCRASARSCATFCSAWRNYASSASNCAGMRPHPCFSQHH